MVDNSIKVGFCVAYDWYFLTHALPLVYDRADVICLSMDKDHCSWTQKSFHWDEAGFNELIRKIDIAGKIIFYKENFHLTELTAKQNEVRQRNLMAQKMGKGGWHIQLDCDEYFQDFDKFVDYLKSLPDSSHTCNVVCRFVTLFKEINDGFLYVYPEKSQQIEYFQIATKYPLYEQGRRNGYFNIYSNFLVIHQSWARSDAEIKQKLLNWGHVNDFDLEAYFEFWKSVNDTNYKAFKNLHPIQPSSWPTLRFIGCQSLDELIQEFRKKGFPTLNFFRRLLKNSRMVSRILSRLRLIM